MISKNGAFGLTNGSELETVSQNRLGEMELSAVRKMETDIDTLRVGCAGWSIPSQYSGSFPSEGTHLERYSAQFNAVEINSSFYRPHRVQTYAKWAASVPENFRFAVKIPKSITHEHRLKDPSEPLQAFLNEVAGLGEKLGPLLIQLPPSLAFDPAIATEFFSVLRKQFRGQAVCEPRHASWFSPRAAELLVDFEVSRVFADPAPVPGAFEPGGWRGLAYYRLHGSPTIYRSAYPTSFLIKVAEKMRHPLPGSVPAWCIFDNTAEGAATGNALELNALL